MKIETGRCAIPTPIPVEERVCDLCGILDDEFIHENKLTAFDCTNISFSTGSERHSHDDNTVEKRKRKLLDIHTEDPGTGRNEPG